MKHYRRAVRTGKTTKRFRRSHKSTRGLWKIK